MGGKEFYFTGCKWRVLFVVLSRLLFYSMIALIFFFSV